MLRRIVKRLTYTNVAMTLALVLAMSGGAYAAKHFLITSIKQISPSVRAALSGKKGAVGKAGPAGKDGVQGAQGSEGKEGHVGAQGDTGAAGAKGATGPQGPTGTTGAKGSSGPQGTSGPQGPTGEPWTPNKVLPPGATESGSWAASGLPVKFFTNEILYASISFGIATATAPSPHVIESGETTECPGGAEKPEALSGNLCIFEQSKTNVKTILSSDPGSGGLNADGVTGSVLFILAETAGEDILAKGTWAVTG